MSVGRHSAAALLLCDGGDGRGTYIETKVHRSSHMSSSSSSDSCGIEKGVLYL